MANELEGPRRSNGQLGSARGGRHNMLGCPEHAREGWFGSAAYGSARLTNRCRCQGRKRSGDRKRPGRHRHLARRRGRYRHSPSRPSSKTRASILLRRFKAEAAARPSETAAATPTSVRATRRTAYLVRKVTSMIHPLSCSGHRVRRESDDEWRAHSDGVGELHIFCPGCRRGRVRGRPTSERTSAPRSASRRQ